MSKTITVGDRVKRSDKQAFRYSKGEGTVIEITQDDRCKIKWDEKASTGQQHSTIQKRFLITLNK